MSAQGLTADQYEAIATLLRMRDPSREAARLVLVDGMRPADAARTTGLTPQAVGNAVSRVRRGLDLAVAATS